MFLAQFNINYTNSLISIQISFWRWNLKKMRHFLIQFNVFEF